ncbi:hypothetical protein DL768_009318 [Monosporascus sp. mg162]|nr:hypothetical protein DL768_009318 [Monosporascus sp. mg162]
MAEQLILKGTLEGHNGWVTSLATSIENPNMLLSGSRDKTLIIWNLTRDESQYGYPKRSLHGHSHIVSDCVISSDGAYALSASWDKTLRLWELATGTTTRRFVGHTNDVLSVSFSADNRQIVSGSRDRTIKLWNTLGDCKFTITDKGHTEWVSCVRFSPNPQNPVIVSSSWDKLVKVWELSTCKLQTDHIGHTGYINTVTISPDGSLCASGGKDGTTMLWDLNESKHLYSLNAGDEIHALTFSPNRYWLCAATASSIIIFDLEKKSKVDELKPEFTAVGKKSREPECATQFSSAVSREQGEWLEDGGFTCGASRRINVFLLSVRSALRPLGSPEMEWGAESSDAAAVAIAVYDHANATTIANTASRTTPATTSTTMMIRAMTNSTVTAFDPRNQTFLIAGPDGIPSIPISMATIEAQRVRLASVAVNYGCQLGLTLMALLAVLLLQPTPRLPRGRTALSLLPTAPIPLLQLAALLVGVARLSLLVLYFPGPLAGYYVAWTRDASVLGRHDYAGTTASAALGVVQFGLVEAALVLQTRALTRTWGAAGCRSWWDRLLALFSVVLAGAAVAVRAVWAAQHAQLLRGRTLPVALTPVGEAAVALGAVSVFYFCGLFFAHLALHLALMRGVLVRPLGSGSGSGSGAGPGSGSGCRCRLTKLEILAIGNGVLMLVPSLFAGLDIAADLGDTRVLPFDAGSWVQTITATGLPLIGLVAHYRGDGGSNHRSRHSDSDSYSFRRASVKVGAAPPRPRGDSVLWEIRGRDVNGDGVAQRPGQGLGRRREKETVRPDAGMMEDVELGQSGSRGTEESNENEDPRHGSGSGSEGERTIRVRTDYVVTVEEAASDTGEYSRRQSELFS